LRRAASMPRRCALCTAGNGVLRNPADGCLVMAGLGTAYLVMAGEGRVGDKLAGMDAGRAPRHGRRRPAIHAFATEATESR
jgi:hypothetical protein